MADVTLLSFLKGYLEGRVRQREEEQQRAQAEQQQAVILAQFLENLRQRESEEKYRQFQMDMSLRQMDLAERQRTFMESHYRFMEDIQKADLELRQQENAQRREALSLQIQGNIMQMFLDLYKQFGSIDGALGVMKKSPIQAVRDWANNVDPQALEQMRKPQALDILRQQVAQWQGLDMPSDRAINNMLEVYGLKGSVTPNEAKALFQVRVEANRASYGTQLSLKKAETEIETAGRKSIIAYEYGLKQKMEKMKNAVDEVTRKRIFFNMIEDLTPFHTVLTGDIVATPEATKEAFIKIEGNMRDALMKIGVDTNVATFYSMSGLGSVLITNKNVPNNVVHLWQTYSANRAMQRSWLQGATEVASMALGRPATLDEVRRFVINYGNRVTGTADGGETLWANMTLGMDLPIGKSSGTAGKKSNNAQKQKPAKLLLRQGVMPMD
jgi:hypothetical protein